MLGGASKSIPCSEELFRIEEVFHNYTMRIWESGVHDAKSDIHLDTSLEIGKGGKRSLATAER